MTFPTLHAGGGDRRDFISDRRLLRIAALALPIGAASTGAAWGLLHLIRFFTNLFFFQVLSDGAVSPATHTLGAAVIAVPVVGGLVIGLMARYGSEKIRGHGIPEAIEAILFGKSRMSLKVAVLKPLSSGIAIGSGGPFGAEGPIIMTGGEIGSLVGQCVHITGAERKTLLVAGAVAGMTAVFGTPIAAVLLAVELLLFELRSRSLLPVAIACCVAAALRPFVLDAGPLFPQHTTIAAEETIADAMARHFGGTQVHRAFPVVAGTTLVGMIDRESLARGAANPAARHVRDLFGANVPPMALPRENCRTIATRLAVHGIERLPVVTDPDSRRLVGLVSRSDLVKTSLALFDEEERPERFAGSLDLLRRRFRSLTRDEGDRG